MFILSKLALTGHLTKKKTKKTYTAININKSHIYVAIYTIHNLIQGPTYLPCKYEFDCISSWSLPSHLLCYTITPFLAHLSWKAHRWAYSTGRHPSSVNIFKQHLWSNSADSYQISHIGSIGQGNKYLYFLFQLVKNYAVLKQSSAKYMNFVQTAEFD